MPEGRPATSAGPHASVATKTAEALGETVAGAYAYPDATAEEARNRSRATVRHRAASHGSEAAQPLMIAAVGFAVGVGGRFTDPPWITGKSALLGGGRSHQSGLLPGRRSRRSPRG